MRLIDSEMIKIPTSMVHSINGCLMIRVEDVQRIVSDQPTAFDKEKVKEQIQIFRSKFECTCCPKNIGKHIPVSCDECMDTFAKANIVIVEKGGIK